MYGEWPQRNPIRWSIDPLVNSGGVSMSKNAAVHALDSSTHAQASQDAALAGHRSWKFEGSTDERAAQIMRLVRSRDLSTESRSASLAHAEYLRRRSFLRRVFFIAAIIAYLLLAAVLVITAVFAESHNQFVIAAAGAGVTAVIAAAFTLFTEREVRQRRRTMRRTQELLDSYASRYAARLRENEQTGIYPEGTTIER